MATASPPLQPKTHYQILDGLRGVAAMTVVVFHTFEPWDHGDPTRQIINHGYLAVDFFFLLSGFVIAYAYDDRWPRMRVWEFCKRRLIRLQPMVVLGSLLGAALFYLQASPACPFVAHTPVWKLLVVTLIGATLIPVRSSLDIRGWGQMHPLNGPAWSLFFEYIANILYALGLRKLSNRALAVFVLLAAIFLAQFAITSRSGDVVGGFRIDRPQLHIGFARLLYPFLAGMLLMRLGKRIRIPDAFATCSLLLVAILAFPRVGGHQHFWANGLYESVAIIVFFPLIVAIGAGSRIHGPRSLRVCRFLGDISYPLYITHYPLIYLYVAWLSRGPESRVRGAAMGVLLFVVAVAIAWVSLRFYDQPVRAWLTRRLLPRAGKRNPSDSGSVVPAVFSR